MHLYLFSGRKKWFGRGVFRPLTESTDDYQSFKNDDEKELFEYCLKNDRKAQKKFYEKYFGKMMATARRYIADHDEAMGVVNNAFLKIFTNIHQYQGKGSFQGWMIRVMINTSLDYLRTTKNYSSTISLSGEIMPAEVPDIVFEDYQNIDIEQLYLMIDKLPPASRTVFNLYAIDGFSHQEISEKLGISIGTSKAHLHFARLKLKEMLFKLRRQE